MAHWVPAAKTAVKVLKWVATKTPTPFDDQALALLEVQLDNPAFVAFIDKLIGHTHEGDSLQLMAASEATLEIREAVAAAGIDWAAFLKNVLPLILQIIALFAKE